MTIFSLELSQTKWLELATDDLADRFLVLVYKKSEGYG